MSGLVLLLLAYLYAIVEIIRHFRNIRFKEVEAVFAASLRNRELFDPEFREAKARNKAKRNKE
jgi:hypothetical protein